MKHSIKKIKIYKKLPTAILIIALVLIFKISCTSEAKDTKIETTSSKIQGVWVATVFNIDWPSQTNLSQWKQKIEITKMIDNFEKIGINDVIFQVKPAQEAFYKSSILPYSMFLTGSYTNKYPFDPLEYMLKYAHKKGIRVHAWVNPFRILNKDVFLEYAGTNKEGWVIEYGKYHWINPAIEEARSFVLSTIMEIVDNYDIDGIHIDDYFYPYAIKGVEFDDNEVYQKNKKVVQSKDDFRREAINDFVYTLSSSIKKSKPDISFGISPFAVWRNNSDDTGGSKTSAMQTSYDSLYADTKKWFHDKIVDYMAPQIYFDNVNTNVTFDNILHWWESEALKSDTPLYIGLPAYKSTGEYANYNIDNYKSNFNRINNSSNIGGIIHYSAKYLMDTNLGLGHFLKESIKK